METMEEFRSFEIVTKSSRANSVDESDWRSVNAHSAYNNAKGRRSSHHDSMLSWSGRVGFGNGVASQMALVLMLLLSMEALFLLLTHDDLVGFFPEKRELNYHSFSEHVDKLASVGIPANIAIADDTSGVLDVETRVLLDKPPPVVDASRQDHKMLRTRLIDHSDDYDNNAEEERVSVPTEPLDTSELLDGGRICAMVPVYLEFFDLVEALVTSLTIHFPSLGKIVLAAHPFDVYAFNSTIGLDYPDRVEVVAVDVVSTATLWADVHCGADFPLVMYMAPGSVLSRPVLVSDFYNSQGNLLVGWMDENYQSKEQKRTLDLLETYLGWRTQIFGVNQNILLPSQLNPFLRMTILNGKGHLHVNQDFFSILESGDSFRLHVHSRPSTSPIPEDFESIVDSELPTLLEPFRNIDMLELVAGFIYGIMYGKTFPDKEPRGQHPVQRPEFAPIRNASSPTFTCRADVGLARTHDVAGELMRVVNGDRQCGADGWLQTLDTEARGGTLPFRSDVEFAPEYGLLEPNLHDPEYTMSAVLRTFHGDVHFVPFCIESVKKNAPFLSELVVVVVENDGPLFRNMVERHMIDSPFPIRLHIEKELMPGDMQQKYSKITADTYVNPASKFILHIDSDVIILEHLRYSHIFRFGKPLLPLRYYTPVKQPGDSTSYTSFERASLPTTLCWQWGTTFALGKESGGPIAHEYSVFNTHVYPIGVYKALRDHLEAVHEMSFLDFMRTRSGKCTREKVVRFQSLIRNGTSLQDVEDAQVMFSDFNAIGAFLWKFMRNTVSWVAVDPLGRDRENYLRADKYTLQWVCQASGRTYELMADDPEERSAYMEYFGSVTTPEQCNHVGSLTSWKTFQAKNRKSTRRSLA